MRLVLVVFLAFFQPVVSYATDSTAPVKEIMDATAKNWSGKEEAGDFDIFSEERLKRLYSQAFVADYQRAAKAAAAQSEEATSPFDYDVIVNGQESCPLQEIIIGQSRRKNDGTPIVISQFKKSACYGDDIENQKLSTVQFVVIKENGNAVVDDILIDNETGNPTSLRRVMQNIK